MGAWRKTCLGREVPTGDWCGVGRDAALVALWRHRWNPFNSDDDTLPVESICNATGFSMVETLVILGTLQQDEMVELTSEPSPYGDIAKAARLTRKGGDDVAVRIAVFGD